MLEIGCDLDGIMSLALNVTCDYSQKLLYRHYTDVSPITNLKEAIKLLSLLYTAHLPKYIEEESLT